MTDSSDQGFNDDELQDIMDEIESLEKEYEETDTPAETTAEAAHVEEAPAAEGPVAEAEESNVVPMTEATPVASKGTGENQMDFAGSGTMDFNLSFYLGGQVANLNIDQQKGLTLQLEGMELSITEEDGCVVKMSGGVQFTVPLANGSDSSVKKAS